MGCSPSKIDKEESVTRCKARKRFMNQAVQHRHAFAAATAAYIHSLKDTGAAIRQFGEGDAKDNQTFAFLLRPEPALPPPPPPFPAFASSPAHISLSRAGSTSRPSLRNSGELPQPGPIAYTPTHANEDDEDIDYLEADAQLPPPPPLEVEQHISPPSLNSDWELLDMFSPRSSYQMDDADTSEVREVAYERSESRKVHRSCDPTEEHREHDLETQVADETASKKAYHTLQDRSELSSGDTVEKRELQLIVPVKRWQGDRNDLAQVLKHIDDLFLVSFDAGKEVSRMLETRKAHYHSNFVDSTGIIDHHAEVLSAMSWEWSGTRIPLAIEDANGKIHKGEDTHALTLDKLLAWEKKLYDEVKAGVLTRIQLMKKYTQLKNQKERGMDYEIIEETRTAVKRLQTRYMVEFQAVASASLEIQKLRDDDLYPQLVNLVEGLSKMWKAMFECHHQQYQMVRNMECFDNSSVPEQTTDLHRKNTLQLEAQTNLWYQHIDGLITSQKQYMIALYSWLRLNIMQNESEVKDKSGSPWNLGMKIYHLCQAWIQSLEKLPGKAALQAVKGFSEILHETVMKQEEELKQKKRYQIISKELHKKMRSLMNFERKYTKKHVEKQVPDEQQVLVQAISGIVKSPLQEKEAIVHALKRKVEEEREKHEKLCVQSRNLTLASLQSGLPPVLHAISTFSYACSETYAGLHTLTLTGKIQKKLHLSY